MASANETSRPALTEDDRFDLQYAATASERRNQPRVLVLGAAVLLAASSLAVLFSSNAMGNARTTVNLERIRETEIASLITQLEVTDDSSQSYVHERVSRAPILIKNATQSVDVENVNRDPIPSSDNLAGGLVLLKYKYNGIKSHSMETLLQSVEASLSAVEGLAVREIELIPESGDKGWTMNIEYSHLVEAN